MTREKKTTDTIASNTLASRAMVVSLTIRQWSGRKLDREVTEETNSRAAAEADAGRYNKMLLDKSALESITKVVSAARTGFITRTLPWVDDGSRIMSNDAYLPFTTWFNGVVSDFDAAVDDLVAAYPTHVQAARKRLGTMFKETDYPTAQEIRSKFGVTRKIMPVPAADDFRVAMSEAQASRIRDDIEESVRNATEGAVRDVFRRVEEVARRMAERLPAYKPAERKGDKSEGIFRDSIVENVRDLIGILPSLNITGSQEIAALAEKLQPLAVFDAKVLREDEGKRADTAAAAEKILADISDFLA